MSESLGPYLLGPNDTLENGIYTGDARDLAKVIPDESVDLIFTDPVYQNIDDYRWLAETGARVLKDGGSLLAWVTVLSQYDLKPLIGKRLGFCAPLTYVKVGKTYAMFSRRLFVWTTPCLWFAKGKAVNSYMPDTVVSTQSTVGTHKWNKNPEAVLTWLAAFAGIVFDPFTGGGTVPAVCKMLGRQYLAFEIEPATAELARERVRNTQPPLFVEEPRQAEFEEAGWL